jgi:predicted small integral membrane protein
LTVAGLLILLVPLAGDIAALLLGAIVTALLAALVVWELSAPAGNRPPAGGRGERAPSSAA